MKRSLLLACLIPLLACGKPADRPAAPHVAVTPKALASVGPYDLEVTFDGLIAFAKQKVNGNPAVWALLVKADYDPNGTPTDSEVPPCAKSEVSLQQLPREFPPHVAALRIKDAEVELNGVPVGGVVPLFFLDGLDLRFDTGLKNPSSITLDSLVSRSTFAGFLGGTPDDYKKYDTIDPTYLGNFATAQTTGHLSARVLIDFGKSVISESCVSTTPRLYNMKAKIQDTCTSSGISLAESVKVSQQNLTDPITITLDAKRTLTVKPKASGNKLTVEVLNILPFALADFHYDGCEDPHTHPAAFRWFYYLLKEQPSDCSKYFFTCPSNGTAGGTKCPQIGLQE